MEIKGDIELEKIISQGFDKYTLIDVRTPSEFIADTIPVAENVPVFYEDERKKIGTVYKHQGSSTARLLAVKLISPLLPDFIEKINSYKCKEKKIVLFCWRGGLRSDASVTFCRLAGISVIKLKGGYKTYRNYINDYFNKFSDSDNKFIVLFGNTGSGKTELLHRLKKEGCSIVDLENAAHHKGSSFGDINESKYKSVTQKNFESTLWKEIFFSSKNTFFIEGESRKIGKVKIPDNLFKKMLNGKKVLIELPLDFRIDYTIKTYKPHLFADEIKSSLINIKKYVGGENFIKLSEYLEKEDYESFTSLLLTKYYDILYKKSFPENPDFTVKGNNLDDVYVQLKEIYSQVSDT